VQLSAKAFLTPFNTALSRKVAEDNKVADETDDETPMQELD
jgi:hypothetical protein